MSDTNHNRGSPRLLFTQEERDNPKLERLIEKAEKAGDKAAIAQKKLKTHRQLVFSKTDQHEGTVLTGKAAEKKAANGNVVPEAGKPAAKASDAGKSAVKKQAVRLHFEETKAKPLSSLHHPVAGKVHSELHRQIAAANEDDNTAVQAALKADDATKSALQMGEHGYHALRMRPYRKAEKAEHALDKANLRYLQAKGRQDNPRLSSNPYSRLQQKRAIRKEYAAAKAGKATSIHTQQTIQKTEKAATKAGAAVKRTVDQLRKNPKVLLIGLLAGMLLIAMSGLQSCTPLAQSVLESIVIGTYPATEDDVRAAERAYAAKEKDLESRLEHYAQEHPEYDEVEVDADEIWHDPYALIAIISAYFDGQDWTIDTAYPVIEKYFDLQYKLTETITTETRYTTETRTGTHLVTDPETGLQHTEPYTYEVSVPYLYKTCKVRLENKILSHMPVYSMSHHTMGMYALYMATHGNMEGIFSGNPHATPLRDPYIYEIPQETLDADSAFAALMEEANKYVGYPYVWGGASPETSFDCSGFVSYVFTNSGVYNTGRLGATGLHGLCRTVSAGEVRPGDLVFFEGTMGDRVVGITHVGIYVGNNRMIHCGSPIGYADLTESYWQQHFHSYGRVPY